MGCIFRLEVVKIPQTVLNNAIGTLDRNVRFSQETLKRTEAHNEWRTLTALDLTLEVNRKKESRRSNPEVLLGTMMKKS